MLHMEGTQGLNSTPQKGFFLGASVQRTLELQEENSPVLAFESLMFTPDLIGSLRKSGDQRDGGEKVLLAGRIYTL